MHPLTDRAKDKAKERKMSAKEIAEWKRLRRLWMRGVATINQINRARALSRKAANLKS